MKGDPEMKRFVRCLFAVLMVLLLFVGCSEPQEENEEPSAPNRNAVLKAVLKGEPKKPAGKTVSAQKYDQREYDEEQEAAFRRMVGAI